MYETVALAVDAIKKANAVFRFIARHSPWFRRHLIAQHSGAVLTRGLYFFPSRDALNLATGSLGKRIKDAKKLDMALVVGEGFLNADLQAPPSTRILLPSPSCAALGEYMASRERAVDADRRRAAIQKARGRQIRVRIVEHFIHRSIVLADTDRENGWVHLEDAFQYWRGQNGPSVTVLRAQFPECVAQYQEWFDRMWEAAKEPEV